MLIVHRPGLHNVLKSLKRKGLELLDCFPGGNGWVGWTFGRILLIKHAGGGLWGQEKKKSKSRI
jgi:hypothetical protein